MFKIRCIDVKSGVARKMRRQLHLWVYESDFTWLRFEPEAHDETMSATIRRLISEHRARQAEEQIGRGRFRVTRALPRAQKN